MQSKVVEVEKEVVVKVKETRVQMDLTIEEFRILRGILGGGDSDKLLHGLKCSEVVQVFGLKPVQASDILDLAEEFINQWPEIQKSLTK